MSVYAFLALSLTLQSNDLTPSAITQIEWIESACPRACHQRTTRLYPELDMEVELVGAQTMAQEEGQISTQQWSGLTSALIRANFKTLPPEVSIDHPELCPGLVLTDEMVTIQIHTENDFFSVFYVKNCHFSRLDTLLESAYSILPELDDLPD